MPVDTAAFLRIAGDFVGPSALIGVTRRSEIPTTQLASDQAFTRAFTGWTGQTSAPCATPAT